MTNWPTNPLIRTRCYGPSVRRDDGSITLARQARLFLEMPTVYCQISSSKKNLDIFTLLPKTNYNKLVKTAHNITSQESSSYKQAKN